MNTKIWNLVSSLQNNKEKLWIYRIFFLLQLSAIRCTSENIKLNGKRNSTFLITSFPGIAVNNNEYSSFFVFFFSIRNYLN